MSDKGNQRRQSFLVLWGATGYAVGLILNASIKQKFGFAGYLPNLVLCIITVFLPMLAGCAFGYSRDKKVKKGKASKPGYSAVFALIGAIIGMFIGTAADVYQWSKLSSNGSMVMTVGVAVGIFLGSALDNRDIASAKENSPIENEVKILDAEEASDVSEDEVK